MKKVLYIVFALLLVFSLAVSSCTAEIETEQLETDSEVANEVLPFEGQTVRVAVGSFMSTGASMFEEEWEAKTGANLEVVEIPFGDLYQRIFASFSTGSDEFDIAIYASNWIPEFAKNGYIMSLENYYSEKDNWDQVLPKTQKVMYFLGDRYSVPMDGDVIFGYYRLHKHGINIKILQSSSPDGIGLVMVMMIMVCLKQWVLKMLECISLLPAQPLMQLIQISQGHCSLILKQWVQV